MNIFIPNPLLQVELEKGLDMTDPANTVAEPVALTTQRSVLLCGVSNRTTI